MMNQSDVFILPIDGTFDQTIDELTELQIHLIETEPSMEPLINVYTKKSLIYLLENKFEEARSFGRYAMDLSNRYDMDSHAILTSIHLAHVLLTFKKIDAALQLLPSPGTSKQQLDGPSLGYALFVYAKVSINRKDYPDGVMNLKNALPYFDDAGFEYLVALIHLELARIHLIHEKPSYAKSRASRAKNILENNLIERQKIEFVLGQCVEELDAPAAEVHYRKSYDICKKLDLKNKLIRVNETLARYYNAIGKAEAAMDCKKESQKIERSPILREKTDKSIIPQPQPRECDAMIELNFVSIIEDTRLSTDVIYGPVTLDIEEGDYIVFRGPSGHGKSTLLNLITGRLPATHGYVKYKGNTLSEIASDETLRAEFANDMIILNLLKYQSATTELDDIIEKVEQSNLSNTFKEEAQELYSIIKSMLQSNNSITRDPSGTQKGGRKISKHFFESQKKRYTRLIMGYLMYFVDEYKILIGDEPLEDFNPTIVEKMAKLFKIYHEDTNATILINTHFDKLAQYSTKEVFIRRGKISDVMIKPVYPYEE